LPRRAPRRITADKVSRYRVVCHLPTQKEGEEKAATKVIDRLGQLATLGGFSGFTVSVTTQSAFHGYWRPSGRSQFRKEDIVLCIMDIQPPRGVAVRDFALKLKRLVNALYAKHSARQQKLWVVVHSVNQYD